jgi:hypothetical protein
MNTHHGYRGWWPDEPFGVTVTEFVRQIAETLPPVRIVRLLRKSQTTAIPQELLELFWEATAQILRQRCALLAF